MTDTRKRRHRQIMVRDAFLALAMLTAVFVMIVVLIVKIDNREQQERAQDQVDVNYLNCLRGNELRQVNIDNEKEPGRPLDLTPLLSGDEPGWFVDFTTRLKTASEQAAAAPIDPESRQGRRLARLEDQLRDCEAEWSSHTPGLHLVHDR